MNYRNALTLRQEINLTCDEEPCLQGVSGRGGRGLYALDSAIDGCEW